MPPPQQPSRKPYQETVLLSESLQIRCKELGYPSWNVQDCQVLSVDKGPALEADVFFTWTPSVKKNAAAGIPAVPVKPGLQPMRVGIQLGQRPDSIVTEQKESKTGYDQFIVELSGKSLGAGTGSRLPCTVQVSVSSEKKRNEIIRLLAVPSLPISNEVDGNESVGTGTEERKSSRRGSEHRCAARVAC
jgi:hypothetical protein